MEDREGRYRCTLLLPDRALQHLPGLSKHEFHGKACDSAKEAGKSAADAFLGRSYFTGDSTEPATFKEGSKAEETLRRAQCATRRKAQNAQQIEKDPHCC